MKNKEQLIKRVIQQMEWDLVYGDVGCVEELLSFIPVPNLIQSLDEDEWSEYEGFEEMSQEARNRAKEVVNYGKV